MVLHLVRHADALPRSAWGDRDSLRPLSARGKAEARGLVDLLADGSGVDAVVSSPAVRCVATVDPLARHVGVPVDTDALLYEGADPSAVLERWYRPDADETMVLCSHGDVIPEVVRLLRLRGVDAGTHGAGRCAKASVWTVADGTARYHGPPVVPADGAHPDPADGTHPDAAADPVSRRRSRRPARRSGPR